MKLIIKTHTLKAVVAFAGKEQTRFYLHGVYIEQQDNKLRLTATNGHALVTAQPKANTYHLDDDAALVPFILPADLINAIKSQYVLIDIMDGVYRLYSWSDDKAVTLDSDGIEAIMQHGAAQTFKPIDGTFPDYRRVIPPVKDATTSAFNPVLLGLFDKFSIKKRTILLNIHASGEHPALVSGETDDCMFFGAVMPMRRNDKGAFTIPSWFYDTKPVVTKETTAA